MPLSTGLPREINEPRGTTTGQTPQVRGHYLMVFGTSKPVIRVT